MLNTKDSLMHISVAADLSQIAFPEADFSIVNIPTGKKAAVEMFSHLYNTPASKHISLVLTRYKKDLRLEAMSRLSKIEDFRYFDTVHIWYEKASGASNTAFIPLCESGHLFYKGDLPDVKKTSWFSEEQSNATNHWAVTSSEGEKKNHTYYQKFNFETALLLFGMSKPSSTRKFIYGLEANDDNLFAFIYKYKIGCYCYAETDREAGNILQAYESFVSKKT